MVIRLHYKEDSPHAMQREEEEPNYLARTKAEKDPESFVTVVREAFLAEHGCEEQQEIAAVINVSPPQISHYFKYPERMEAKSVRNLLDRLTNERHKRRIVRAWISECLGMNILSRTRGKLPTANNSAEEVLDGVNTQIRMRRLTSAAFISLEAAQTTTDVVPREVLLDKAYQTRLRLDLPGQAMSVVRMIAEGAVERKEMLRLAAAHYYRARILLGLQNAQLKEVEHALDQMETALGEDPPQPAPKYFLGSPEALTSLRRVVKVTFIERGVIAVQKLELRKLLKEVTTQASTKAQMKQKGFGQYLLAARIHLLLGETFQAEECLEQAYKFGQKTTLHAREMCAVVQAHVLAATRPPAEVSKYLRTLASNCSFSEDRYDWRIAEYQLARLESEMFPPSHPVL